MFCGRNSQTFLLVYPPTFLFFFVYNGFSLILMNIMKMHDFKLLSFYQCMKETILCLKIRFMCLHSVPC